MYIQYKTSFRNDGYLFRVYLKILFCFFLTLSKQMRVALQCLFLSYYNDNQITLSTLSLIFPCYRSDPIIFNAVIFPHLDKTSKYEFPPLCCLKLLAAGA